ALKPTTNVPFSFTFFNESSVVLAVSAEELLEVVSAVIAANGVTTIMSTAKSINIFLKIFILIISLVNIIYSFQVDMISILSIVYLCKYFLKFCIFYS